MDKFVRIKNELQFDLNNPEKTARICRTLSSPVRLEIIKRLIEKPMTISQLAEEFCLPMSSMCLHVKSLQEAEIIRVSPKPGTKGNSKLCGMITSNISIDLYAHVRHGFYKKPTQYVYMPIGNYSCCDVTPPCGIVTPNSYLDKEDAPYGFFNPERTNASLLWFTSGMIEYCFPTKALREGVVKSIEFSFEICSEAPGYNNEWPSDVDLELNHRKITTLHLAGDYGGRRGIYNPAWWSDTSTQYGEYKTIQVTQDGCYFENHKISRETLSSLELSKGYQFSFILRIDPHSEHVGGLNLFGRYFGDYNQDIIMKIEYD